MFVLSTDNATSQPVAAATAYSKSDDTPSLEEQENTTLVASAAADASADASSTDASASAESSSLQNTETATASSASAVSSTTEPSDLEKLVNSIEDLDPVSSSTSTSSFDDPLRRLASESSSSSSSSPSSPSSMSKQTQDEEQPDHANALARMLFIYGKLNRGIGYVQGRYRNITTRIFLQIDNERFSCELLKLQA